jgi:membrane fusion protein (multidrug efflux system)
MNRRGWIGSSLLLVTLAALGAGLAFWKHAALKASAAESASQPEPTEAVSAAVATEREHRQTTSAVGTVLALRSISLRNEVPGTVRTVNLTPGQVVEEGTVLVALDVSVEEAELKAQQAQAALARTVLARLLKMSETDAASSTEVDRAVAERDVALAQIARTRAIMARKTIRAPFRARVGMADVHVGQYLDEGRLLTTLQGVDDAVHVDFTVAQRVAAGLREGDTVEVVVAAGGEPVPAKIVAIDARVDPATRNAAVRARIAAASGAPAPGASVRVRVPVGPPAQAVAVPVSALRKGPAGDHVFVLAPDPAGKTRARLRPVKSGAVLGDEVLIHAGLSPGEQVATAGSFKLREDVLVAVAPTTTAAVQ